MLAGFFIEQALHNIIEGKVISGCRIEVYHEGVKFGGETISEHTVIDCRVMYKANILRCSFCVL